MARAMLYSDEMNKIVERRFAGNAQWTRREVSVPVSIVGSDVSISITIPYFYNQNKNCVIIGGPLAVTAGSGDAAEPTYQAAITAIADELGNKTFGLGCSLIGKGTGERHYTALYREQGAGGKITVFDSKISVPGRFFNSSDAPTFLEKAWGLITAPFKVFGLWAFDIGKQEKASFLNQNVTIHRLETQPFWDGDSCGLHSTGAVLNMANLVVQGKTTTEQIESSITADKRLDLNAEELLRVQETVIIPVVPNCLSLLSKLKPSVQPQLQEESGLKEQPKVERRLEENPKIEQEQTDDLSDDNSFRMR